MWPVCLCAKCPFLSAARAGCPRQGPASSPHPHAPDPISRTLRNRADQKDLNPNHHGRGLGFLQCDWLVLLHFLADHAGGTTCFGA